MHFQKKKISNVICPKCDSNNTKNVSIIDPKWIMNSIRCLNCDYQDHFIKFKYGQNKV